MHPGKLGLQPGIPLPARRFFLESSSIPCFGVGLFLVCWFLEGARDCSSIPGPGGGEFWEFSLRGDDPKGISRWFPALPVQGVELMSPKGAAAPTAPPCAGAGCKSQRFQGFFPPSFLHFHAGLKLFFFFLGFFKLLLNKPAPAWPVLPPLRSHWFSKENSLWIRVVTPGKALSSHLFRVLFFFALGRSSWNSLIFLLL